MVKVMGPGKAQAVKRQSRRLRKQHGPDMADVSKLPPLRLGIAGLGTVGAGLVGLIEQQSARLSTTLGRTVRVTGVSARSRAKNRGISLEGKKWFDDPAKLAVDPDIDVFVELIGGAEGVAKAAVEAALGAKKHVVTANKALLALHGVALGKLAEKNGVALNFEASVAGGIPVIKTIRESLVGNDIRRIYGILNGTCNFILTKMQSEPTFDIGGFDTAHKLTILTSLAFGTEVALDEIHIEGIESISAADIEAADDLGYRIKLLGVALRTDSGIEARVNPAMVPKNSTIAEVSGVTNAVAIECSHAGNLLLVGPGAGGNATASSVMSDICDIARGLILPPFVTPASKLKPHKRAKLGQHQGAYYVRLTAHDRPGVMAAITKRMAEQDVSLESIVQRRPRKALPGIDARPEPGAQTPVVLITHETTEAAIRKALDGIEKDGKVAGRPQMIRIEKL
jgi:homoserine dehydrogenase